MMSRPDLKVTIVEYACDVLTYISQNFMEIERFWREGGVRHYDWEQARDKLYHETALLLLICERARQLNINSAPSVHLAKLFSDYCAENPNIEMICMHPQTAPGVALVPLVTSVIFAQSSDYTRLIRTIIESGAHGDSERLPFRELERRWVQGLYGQENSIADVVDHTLVSKLRDPNGLTRSDVYAITHAIMFATDFGQKPLVYIDVAEITHIIDFLAMKSIIDDDLDILGELLICGSCIRQPPTRVRRIGIQLIRDVWSRHGLVPGPTFNPKKYKNLDTMRQEIYSILECYHTTYVAGIMELMIAMVGKNNDEFQSDKLPSREWNTHELVQEACNLIDLLQVFPMGLERREDYSCERREWRSIMPPRLKRLDSEIGPEIAKDFDLVWASTRGSINDLVAVLAGTLDHSGVNYPIMIAVKTLIFKTKISMQYKCASNVFLFDENVVVDIVALLRMFVKLSQSCAVH